jgi:hypothetical protein
VVLTDRLDRFIEATTKAQKHTDEKLAELSGNLNRLIGHVAGLRPPPRR